MVEPEESETPGQSSESLDAGVLMEEIVDTLKLINYEESFLSTKGFKPLTRAQFSLPGANPSEQFIYFTALASWLLQINGSQASFNKYDDPSTVANSIIVEMKKLGIDLDFPPGKLRGGHGEGPCLVLLALAKKALQAKKFKFGKPIFPKENEMEGEVIEDDEEGEIVDEAIQEEEEEAVFAEVAAGQPVNQAEEEGLKHNAPVWSSIDPNEWLLEVERVAPRLKLPLDPTGGDIREWRAHLEQTKQLKENIEKDLPDVELKLRKIADDLSKAVERIGSQEKKINLSMGEIAGDYRNQANQLNEVTTRYKQANENVAELSSHYQHLGEKIEEIQQKIETQGKMVTNISPLQAIKEGLKLLKVEGKDMELRSAVLSHALFQSKLKEKSTNDA
ncbi:unnamed protein product [Blepharisma stoltei]|uniref:Intraflagellar transport protein 57 homolog n=1 Tax=Blepharisma stoltei TaxID=1481888 RepID=A0AAU9J5A7_9CILI|nr:unnamed protein product [Blepharisma stoltei]